MKLKIIITLLFIGSFFVACSTSKETVKEEVGKTKVINKFVNDVELDISKTICWINSMPGAKPKFHVSGKFELLKSDNYNLESTKLQYIKIFQKGKELYFISPKVIEKNNGGKKDVTYSTIRGMNINEDLDVKIPLRFELIFKQEKEKLKYYIKDIKVEEVQ